MENNLVTYYLGAGASANAIPTLGEAFKERFKLFVEFVSEFSKQNKIYESELSEFLSIANEISENYTPDTLAKKMTINREFNKLRKIKKVLTGYFCFEQNRIDAEDLFRIGPEGLSKIDNYKTLNTIVDGRYSPYLSAILDQNNSQFHLPENLRIVSWNYDFQLERAYFELTGENGLHSINSLG